MGTAVLELLAGVALTFVAAGTCRPVGAGEAAVPRLSPSSDSSPDVGSFLDLPSTQSSLGTRTRSRASRGVTWPTRGKLLDSYSGHDAQLRSGSKRGHLSAGALVTAALAGFAMLRRNAARPESSRAEGSEMPEKPAAGREGLARQVLTSAALVAIAFSLSLASRRRFDRTWHSTQEPTQAAPVKPTDLNTYPHYTATVAGPLTAVVASVGLVLGLVRQQITARNRSRAAQTERPPLEKLMAVLHPGGVADLIAKLEDTFLKQVCDSCAVQLKPYFAEVVGTANVPKRAFMFARLVTLLQRARMDSLTDEVVNTVEGTVAEKMEKGESISFLGDDLRRWNAESREIRRACLDAFTLADRAYKQLASDDYESIQQYLLAERAALEARMVVNLVAMSSAAEILSRVNARPAGTGGHLSDMSWEEWSEQKRDILTEALANSQARDELALDAAKAVGNRIVLAGMPFATRRQ